MKLTRYSLFAQKIQTDNVTDLPAYREIAGETLLDHFLGEERLYLAQNNDFITQDEIDRNAPEGTELLLVDRDDLIYGSSDAKAKLKAVLPIDYLAGAYASVFKGGCERMKFDRPLRVAVVDFKDYDSGNANISAEISRQFVHDSCGAIDAKLLKDATGKENAIQFRLGLKGDAPTFAKGMLNPIDLQSLFPPGEAPDAILSSDSFKGNKVAPGWYEYAPQELFLGIKNDSLRTDSSISEVVSIYPETAADVLPILHARARTLAANSRDIVTMAAQALNDYYLDITDEATADRQDEFNTAKLIEMALTSGRYNLLDSAQVRDWLEDRINASWKNLSCADIPELNSYNSTVLPAWDLKYGEVCVPYLPDGEELTFWRSPIVNRTGIVTVKNNLKAWENLQKLGADPNIIYVNVQTLDRIEVQEPQTYARLLAEYGSKARLESEFQTLMELTQMDFDGDTANVIERSRLPELYAAASQNQHPDRKLANFHKSEKNLPVDWTLAQIAAHIRPNYVGVVYSHKKAIELSRAEIELALQRDDRELMSLLAAEYFEKARKLLYKAANDDLLGRSIADVHQLKQVKLPPEVAGSAQTFIDAFPEREILELYGETGLKFVVAKMVRFRANLSFIATNHPPTDRNYLEFTNVDGKTKRKLSAKLLEAIGDFQKLPLRSLLGKDVEAGKLDLYLTQYEKLCALLRKEIDPNHPIVLHGENRRFDRQTNLFTTVEFAEPRQLEAIAALPSTDLPARLRLYQQVLDAGIVATSQLNQDAVDVFKSANIIHDENSQVLARELARDRFASVSGKTRSSAYRDGNLPQPNGIAAPHLIQELCNQNYELPFHGKQETSNPDLIASFRDVPVSATAAAIARFYLSDDREIIDRYKQSSRIEAINGNRKTYLELKLGRDKTNIFALDPQIFGNFLQKNDSIHFNFTEKVAKVGDAILGKLDPVKCQQLANKYPQGLVLDRENFEALRREGNIDLVATHDDRRALTAERRTNLDRLRAAFTLARIEPLEALAAIAQATKGARTSYLVAAYPDALLAHIQASAVDNLILDDGVELVDRARQQLGMREFDFCVDDRGTLVTSAGAELKFLRDRPPSGDYRIDNRIKASSHLKPGTVGTGRLVAEAYLYSLGMAGNKRAIVANLTEAGKQISAQIPATELTLDPVKSLPYTINVMGMECPIRAASEGLVDLWGRIARSMAVEFKQFRYNPIDPSTGKPSFTAVIAGKNGDLYLEGTIPTVDKNENQIREGFPDYFVKTDFSRQVSPCEPVILGWELMRETSAGRVKLGEVTTKSAQDAGFLHEYGWDIAAKTQAEPLPIPQPRSLVVKTQSRLEIPTPDKLFSNAVWEISQPDKVYQSKSKEPIERARIAAIDDLSSNPLLVTQTKIPTIVNDRVELRDRYQICTPTRDLAAVERSLQGDGKRASIPYTLYTADTNPHPSYRAEYQRGYSVLLVDPQALKQGRSKADPVVSRLAKLLAPQLQQPLDLEAYQRELSAARVVRPIVGKNLQDLGTWLQNAGGVEIAPQIEIDKLQPLPVEIAAIGAEAKARFHAKVGTSADRQHTVFYFGAEYLRDRFVNNMGDSPVKIDCNAPQARAGKVYAAVVPTADLESYMREHYRNYSYNYDERGATINKVLSTYGTRNLANLPARATLDVAMGFAANKYIGKSLLSQPSRVELYAEAYGENANTDRYEPTDTVMITGNRFDGKTVIRQNLEPFFHQEYLPLLKAARKSGATIVFGDGNAVDALTRKYLSASGYDVLEHPCGYNEAVPQERASERQQELNSIASGTSLSAKDTSKPIESETIAKIPVNLPTVEEKPQSAALAK